MFEFAALPMLLLLGVLAIGLAVLAGSARAFTTTAERVGLSLGLSPFAVGVIMVAVGHADRREAPPAQTWKTPKAASAAADTPRAARPTPRLISPAPPSLLASRPTARGHSTRTE